MEDKAGWSAFLKHLKERGLNGVRLIISAACLGLAESAAEFFPDAVWQRCVVHWYRNILSQVPATKVREIAAMLKVIHASEDIVAAREKAVRVIEKLRTLRLTKAAELVESTVEETLTYYAFPEEHWRRIRTNNPLERILREIRRRTRVVGAFPDGQSVLNLAAASRCHHRLSQYRASLSPKQMCEKLWTLPLEIDLVRPDRAVPAAGRVRSRKPCPSASAQRAAAQIPEASRPQQYRPAFACRALSPGSRGAGRCEDHKAGDADPLAPSARFIHSRDRTLAFHAVDHLAASALLRGWRLRIWGGLARGQTQLVDPQHSFSQLRKSGGGWWEKTPRP
jgi:hypothetical protein